MNVGLPRLSESVGEGFGGTEMFFANAALSSTHLPFPSSFT